MSGHLDDENSAGVTVTPKSLEIDEGENSPYTVVLGAVAYGDVSMAMTGVTLEGPGLG